MSLMIIENDVKFWPQKADGSPKESIMKFKSEK